jgi:hypothetical protein
MITCECCGKQVMGLLKNPNNTFHCGGCRERKMQRETKRQVTKVYFACFVVALIIACIVERVLA